MFFLALAAMVGLGIGPAQKPGRFMSWSSWREHNIRLQPQINGLRDGLEELKYVEGENLKWQRIEGGTREELRTNLKSVVERQRTDVLVTLGTTETNLAKEVAPSIPTVFLPAADPVKSGFVRSLPSPGTNLTGLTFFTDNENLGKQLEVFKQVVPSLDKVGVLFDSRLKSRLSAKTGKGWLSLVHGWAFV